MLWMGGRREKLPVLHDIPDEAAAGCRISLLYVDTTVDRGHKPACYPNRKMASLGEAAGIMGLILITSHGKRRYSSPRPCALDPSLSPFPRMVSLLCKSYGTTKCNIPLPSNQNRRLRSWDLEFQVRCDGRSVLTTGTPELSTQRARGIKVTTVRVLVRVQDSLPGQGFWRFWCDTIRRVHSGFIDYLNFPPFRDWKRKWEGKLPYFVPWTILP
jgi:hypothetical protein